MKHKALCQNCSLPLNSDLLGTNVDGSKSPDYCLHCMKGGEITNRKRFLLPPAALFVRYGNQW